MTDFESQTRLNDVIAANLKALRKSRKLSLDNVSEMTGVSKSMLGQIERSESSPTVSTLWKIATGLHISFTSLLEHEEEECIVINNDDITPFLSAENRFRLYPVFPREGERSFEVVNIEIEAGAVSESTPHEPGTEEFVTVFDGTLELVLSGSETYTIPAGSSMNYRADQAHVYKNPGTDLCRLGMIINYR